MKTPLLILLLLPIISFSQKFPINDAGKIEYTEVVKVDNADAATLYNRAKHFHTNQFKSTKDAIQTDDASEKKLVTKKAIPITLTTEKGDKSPYGVLLLSTTVETKDGRYRVAIQDLFHEYYRDGINLSGGKLENERPVAVLSKDAFDKIKVSAEEQVMKYISTLKIYMQTDVTKPVQKDW